MCSEDRPAFPAEKKARQFTPVEVLWTGGLALIALAARLIPGPRTIDDAYITFRYARNLVSGLGFVYNAGERILGTTTPLYTLSLAIPSALLGYRDYPTMALLLNALADAVGVVILCRLALALGASVQVGRATALLWALAPMSVTFAIGGMETSLYITLMLAAFLAYASGRAGLTAALAALVVLARPDGLLAALPLFAHMAWKRRSLPWLEGAIFLAILAPWYIFATLYFGNPFPHSVAAKVVAYHLGRYDALVRLWQHFSTPFFENLVLEPLAFGRYWNALGIIPYGSLYLIAALRLLKGPQAGSGRAFPILAYPPLYVLVFAWANPLIFRWYLAPPLPLFFLGIVLGAWELISALSGGHLRAARVVAGTLLIAALILTLNAWEIHPDHGPDRPAPEMAFIQLEEVYHQAALLLRPEITTRTRIAAGDIGALGYYSDARILDTVGLISPQATSYYPLNPDLLAINYAMPADLILDQAPDYVVTLEVYGRHTLLVSSLFRQQYRQIHALPTDIYGSQGMLIFRRLTS
jgi:hypothetical protein